MNKKIFSIFFVLVIVSMILAGQSVLGVKKGDRALVPQGMLVEIMNPEGIRNDTTFFRFKDLARIDWPGIVIVLGFYKDQVLVKYDEVRAAQGIICPTGAVFFLDKMVFVDWRSGKAIRAQKEIRALKKAIKEILKTE